MSEGAWLLCGCMATCRSREVTALVGMVRGYILPCRMVQSTKAGTFSALTAPAPSGTRAERGGCSGGGWPPCDLGFGPRAGAGTHQGGQREERETQRCGNMICV